MMKKVYICSPLGGNVSENIEKAKVYAKYVFEPCDNAFHDKCMANKAKGVANVIIAGESYGQG